MNFITSQDRKGEAPAKAPSLDSPKVANDRSVLWRETMRLPGVDPDNVDHQIGAVFESQKKNWGAPLLNHLLYARRPTIFRGVRAMWTGLDASGLIDPKLIALINRRVASINGCEF